MAIIGLESEGHQHLASDLVTLIEASLSHEQGIKLVERREVTKLTQELTLSLGNIDKQKIKIGKMLGADIVVLGSLDKTKSHIVCEIRILDVLTGNVLGDTVARDKDISYSAASITTFILKSILKKEDSPLNSIAISQFLNYSNFDLFDSLEGKLYEISFKTIFDSHKYRLLERQETRYLLEENELAQSSLVKSSGNTYKNNHRAADFILKGSFCEMGNTASTGKWIIQLTVELWNYKLHSRVWVKTFRSPSNSITKDLGKVIRNSLLSDDFNITKHIETKTSEVQNLLNSALYNLSQTSILLDRKICHLLQIDKTGFRKTKVTILSTSDPRWSMKISQAITALENVLFLEPNNHISQVYLGLARCELYKRKLNYGNISEQEREKRINTMLSGVELLRNDYLSHRDTTGPRVLFRAIYTLKVSMPYRETKRLQYYKTLLYDMVALAFDDIDLFEKYYKTALNSQYKELLARGNILSLLKITSQQLSALAKDKKNNASKPDLASPLFGKTVNLWGKEKDVTSESPVALFLKEYYTSNDPVYAFMSLSAAGSLFQGRKNYSKASELYRKARAIYKKHFHSLERKHYSKRSWDVLENSYIHNYYGLMADKKYDEAIALLRPFIDRYVSRNAFDSSYPYHVKNLGEALQKSHRIEEAVALYKEVLSRTYPVYVFMPRIKFQEKLNELLDEQGKTTGQANFKRTRLVDIANARKVIYHNNRAYILCMNASSPSSYNTSSSTRGSIKSCQIKDGLWSKKLLPNSLNSNKVSAITLNKNSIWIGTYGNGLYRWRPASKRIKAFSKDTGLLSNYITCLSSSSKNLYVGVSSNLRTSKRGGVLQFNYASQKFSIIRPPHKDIATPISIFYNPTIESLWVGYPKYEKSILQRFSFKTDSWDMFLTGVHGKFVEQILPEKNAIVITMGNQITRYSHEFQSWSSLKNDQIGDFEMNNLFNDNYGRQYCLSKKYILSHIGSTLQVYDRNNGAVTSLNVLKGLSDQGITTVQKFGNAFVLGTNKAMYHLELLL